MYLIFRIYLEKQIIYEKLFKIYLILIVFINLISHENLLNLEFF